ncbi:protein of unknown function [Nitratireductor aquimarinus]
MRPARFPFRARIRMRIAGLSARPCTGTMRAPPKRPSSAARIAAREAGRAISARSPPGAVMAAAVRSHVSNRSSAITCAARFSASGVARSLALLKGGFMTTPENASRPRPAASRAVPVSVTSASSTEIRVARALFCARAMLRRAKPAISGAFSTRVMRVCGQRAATAKPAAPAPAPRSATAPLKLPGSADATSIASTPARWPRRTGWTRRKASRWKESTLQAASGTVSVIVSVAAAHLVFYARILKQLMGRLTIFLVYQDALWQDAERPFQNAHVLVGDETGNARIAQQALDEGNDDGIVGADKLEHAATLTVCATAVNDFVNNRGYPARIRRLLLWGRGH